MRVVLGGQKIKGKKFTFTSKGAGIPKQGKSAA